MKKQTTAVGISKDSKIIVSSFRHSKTPNYTFSYLTNIDEVYTYGTNDQPTHNFENALENLVNNAADYFGLDQDLYKIALDSVNWNSDDSSIKLDLFYSDGKVSWIKLSKTKIPKALVTDKDSGLSDPSDPRNALNESLQRFRDQCINFLHGERNQQAFAFPEQKKEDDLPFNEIKEVN